MKNQITQWSPFDELRGIQNRLATFFGNGEADNGNPAELTFGASDWTPAVDIAEDDDEFLITADLPDIEKKDVKVCVRDGVLTISGEREQKTEEHDKKKKFHRVERSYGHYSRSFRLPDEVDPAKVEAKFDNGVLKVHLEKTEQPKLKETEIKVE